MVEDAGGKNRIDNTYDARLGKFMPVILPEINGELFK
jgi:vacuolar-type H+-ATPase subunit E/Vma4